MSNRWNHSICQSCWDDRNPLRRAVQFVPEIGEPKTCCFCGRPTKAGIYVRQDPAEMRCQGVHPE